MSTVGAGSADPASSVRGTAHSGVVTRTPGCVTRTREVCHTDDPSVKTWGRLSPHKIWVLLMRTSADAAGVPARAPASLTATTVTTTVHPQITKTEIKTTKTPKGGGDARPGPSRVRFWGHFGKICVVAKGPAKKKSASGGAH